MSRQRRLGRHGEDRATAWLLQRGWTILERNWRCSCGELDILALDGDVLVAVEVKLRHGAQRGAAEEALSAAQARRLLDAVSEYLASHPEHADRMWRVDLLGITLDERGRLDRLTHIENAAVSG